MGIGDHDFDPVAEYDKAENIMINAIAQLDVRLPADYIKMACEKALTRWGIFYEGAYGTRIDQPR